jgi:hypothetical protein
MSQLILGVPDDSVLLLKLSDEAAAAEIRLAASLPATQLDSTTRRTSHPHLHVAPESQPHDLAG